MGWITTELVLVSLAAMMSPTTLTFSVLTVVLGDRPLRTAIFFFLGAAGATLAIGVIAAFVIGDVASASHPNNPKTWVAIVDIVLAVLIVGFVVRMLRKPPDPEKTAKTVAQMGKVASSPAVAIIGAGAALANPGAFIPIALKTISELDPSAARVRLRLGLFHARVAAAVADRRSSCCSWPAIGRSASSGACAAGSSGMRSRSWP